METRRLQPGDQALLLSAIRSFSPGDAPDAASDAHLKRAVDDPGCYFFVSLKDTKPVGYLSAYRFPSVEADGFCAYLYDVVVDEGYRREGIGSALIEALKRECVADGVDHIWVGTSLDNHAAQRTFVRTGARKVSDTYVEYIYRLDGGD